jgi:hypothetical protein
MSKSTVQGLDIHEYELTARRSEENPKRWVVGEWEDCAAEEVVGFYFRDEADCDVMFREGEMIRSLLLALCMAAYAENNGYKVISKSRNKITIDGSGCGPIFPSASFTRDYIHTFFRDFSSDEVAFIWPSLMTMTRNMHKVIYRDEHDPNLIPIFLESLTVPRLLAMFDIALATSSDGLMSGWPDLTVMKEGQIIFVEVKVKDRLTTRQIDWIQKYASLPGIEYQVIRLLPA